MVQDPSQPAAGETQRRLYVYNGGFLTQRRVRRILELSGYDIRLGLPGPGDMVGVWGQSPTSPRGVAVASRRASPVLRVEDAFLRSVLPGRDGSPPLGLHLDTRGVHFDPARPSDLEILLATHPLEDPGLLQQAADGIDRLRREHLTKYTGFPAVPPAAGQPATELSGGFAVTRADLDHIRGRPTPLADPDLTDTPGYVLVIDQTYGDASVRASGANEVTFRKLLALARSEHPDARIVIKSHPETTAGHRKGYFSSADCDANTMLYTRAVSPWVLLDKARAVYTVSSQFGFEAILAGHHPVVLGQPFYVGWGLSDDRQPLLRRTRQLTAHQLFAASMILYPRWYDPYRDCLCDLDTAISTLAAETRAWREDHQGWVGTGMRMWKRRPLQQFFGQTRRMVFDDKTPTAHPERRLMVWAGKTTQALDQAGAVHVEDGFLRSRGLGADLIPPLSLVCDDLGIYYDPTRESRLERLIAASPDLPDPARTRAAALIGKLTAAGLSKYNLGGQMLPVGLPSGRRILVPGQVEDDASIRLGAGAVRTNLALLQAARAANPTAVILYKPHPDVEAGLRVGAVPDAARYADAILTRTDVAAALAAADEVWTMTSALGFEALLRGKRVTCLGAPFYAGWGLTTDHLPIPRRSARPDIVGLTHATLIEYPRYHDPLTRRPCPVEVIVDRLTAGQLPAPGYFNRSLAKLQGLFATYAYLWR